jgi:hypothetical protein
MDTNQIHVTQASNTMSLAYEQLFPWMSEEIFPPCPVDNKQDRYFKFSKQHFQVQDDALDKDGYARRVPIDLEPLGFYNTEGHGLEIPLSDEDQANADKGADIEIEYNQKITEMLRLSEENDAANMITLANIPQSVTLSGTNKWSDTVNSDPIPAVDSYKETIMQAVGVEPTDLFLPRPVYRVLRNHPKVYNRIFAGSTPNQPLTPQQLAQAFEVERVHVARILRLSSSPGQTNALSFLYGNFALLFYRPPASGLRVPSFGYTFIWASQTYDCKIYHDQRSDHDVYKGKKYRDIRLIEPNAGFLINAPV